MAKISVVINVIREEVPLVPSVVSSVLPIADEIVLVDMTDGDDNVSEISKKYNLKVYEHKFAPYVEAVRNWGISKAKGDWILILDPDEQVPKILGNKLKKISENPKVDYWRIPRKNIIFGKWMKHSRWWPDYNIRFFKRGSVVWDETIHSIPLTKGAGSELPAKEELAIVHNNYKSVNQFLNRMDRYTTIQARVIANDPKYKFIWMDVIRRPTSEFLSRYFAGEGYKDGLHGLALALLQAFSEIIVYLKVWENEKFLEQSIAPKEISREFGMAQGEFNWWVNGMMINSKNIITSIPHRIKRKLITRKK